MLLVQQSYYFEILDKQPQFEPKVKQVQQKLLTKNDLRKDGVLLQELDWCKNKTIKTLLRLRDNLIVSFTGRQTKK